jgi:hypothetical protein
MSTSIYYVYSYLREDGSPYYIGKGKERRAFVKHNVPVPPIDRIQFIQENMSEEDAFKLEIQLIAFYGRKEIGTGILRNRTNGGDGVSGLKQTPEHIEKNRQSRLGKKRSPEAIERTRQANLGRNQSLETKEKIRQGNSKLWEVTSPTGVVMIIKNLNKFCRENDLIQANMYAVSVGSYTHHKGWKCRKL